MSRSKKKRIPKQPPVSTAHLVTVPMPDGVAAKIVWAEHHLDLIKDRVSTYLSLNPYVIEAKFYDDPPQWPGLKPCKAIATQDETRLEELEAMEPGWVGVARLTIPMPAELPLMVGDFIHNLRSSLDHLARGLVISNGGTPVDSGRGPLTAFPIGKVQPTSRPVSVAGGLAPKALAIIEGLQPYKTRPYTASNLFALGQLSNVDKHRQLHTPAAGTGAGAVFGLVNRTLKIAPVFGQLETFYDGAVMTPCPIAWPCDADVYVEAIVTTVVTLEEVGPETFPVVPLIDRLQALLDFVRKQVVPLFRPYFTAPWPPGF